MNILLVSPLPPPAGGIATWTKGYLNSEQAKRNTVNLVNTAVTRSRVNNFTKKSTLDEIRRTINIFKDMKEKISSNNPDIVHINTSCSRFGMIRDLVCLSFVKNSETKIVIHCHCDTSYMVKGKVSKIIFRKICNKADKIFVLNSSSYNHIKNFIGKESIIIPNFIKAEVLKVNSNKVVSSEIKSILYVGHIVKTKGCDDIIAIAKQMPEKIFTMIGYLSDDIKLIDKPNNIKYIGEISHDEVLNHMKNNDLFLFPTHTEGFPNVVLEAMACGMPIISTDVGAIPDMLENKGGIIIKPRDIEDIKNSINKLEDSKLRANMSIWNIDKVKKNYTIDKVISRIFYEYENIIEED